MARQHYLDSLLAGGDFFFQRLAIEGIDNGPVFEQFGVQLAVEETVLLHRTAPSGDACLDLLHRLVGDGILQRKPLPVVRFADGEYAFYAMSLQCNGLYRQAESVSEIRSVLADHAGKMRTLSRIGRLAPLVHPANSEPATKASWWRFWQRSTEAGSALHFLDFLEENEVALHGGNYLPFYAVYAYFSSSRFARLMDGRHLCIINSTCNLDACREWFERRGSAPRITFAEIPASYVATRWHDMRQDVFERIPQDVDLCLVGAGIGALLVCVDIAERFGVPAIDGGHVLNMMNAREDKSNGVRLYTIWGDAVDGNVVAP
ncbi:MAG: hypothetical protein ACOY32_04975 [Thermodesulfobacteriota bacterium]|jgi:hypothetical protein